MNLKTIAQGAAALLGLSGRKDVADRMAAAGVTVEDLQRAVSMPDGIPERVGDFVRTLLGDTAGEFVQDALSSSEREARVDAAREAALTFADPDDGDIADIMAAYGTSSLVVGASEARATKQLGANADVHYAFYNNLANLKKQLGLDDVGFVLLVDTIRLVATSTVGYSHVLDLPKTVNKHPFIDGHLDAGRRADILKKVS